LSLSRPSIDRDTTRIDYGTAGVDRGIARTDPGIRRALSQRALGGKIDPRIGFTAGAATSPSTWFKRLVASIAKDQVPLELVFPKYITDCSYCQVTFLEPFWSDLDP
jgi:hypothetical protein